MNTLDYTLCPEDDGRSLRDILRNVLQLSEGAIRRAKWSGRLLVNGEPAPVTRRLRAGETVRYVAEENRPLFTVRPLDLALRIPWRSDDLLIIDKPAPLASQSGKNHPDDSLENAVFHWLGCPENYIYRPVNRLDKGTSGLMAVALNGEEQARLQRLLHTDRFRRKYLAVTEGIPPEAEGILDLPIAKAEGATIRRVVSPEGKPCVTRYRVLRTAGNRALLELALETGRTHQIRVHLSHIGCPIVGDFLYGNETAELPGRFALHSAEIVFPLRNGETVSLSSPLPADLEALLE